MHLKSYSLFNYATLVCISGTLADVVTLSLNKKELLSATNRYPILLRRDGVEVELDNQEYGYYVDLDIGTPAQTISVHIDTGSSDLWLMGNGNSRCSTADDYYQNGDINCTGLEFFDPSSSSSYAEQTQFLNISYLDTTFAEGKLAKDTIKIADTTVEGALFAVASEFNTTEGVFGIGLQIQESIVDSSGKQYQYDNFPIKLKESGAIGSVSYSLYLNGVDESSGTIIFGGVDHGKYTGTLTVVPMVADYASYRTADVVALSVEMTKLSWNVGGDNITLLSGSAPAILDSGSSLCRLPYSVFRTLLASLDGSYSSSIDAGLVYCDIADNYDLGSLEFKFNAATINVDLSEFLIPVRTRTGAPYVDGGRRVCMIGASSDEELVLLGDSFLHSTYAVYDLENKVIGLAQASIGGGNSDSVEAIGSNGIPSASSDSNAVFKSVFSGFSTLPYTTISIGAVQSESTSISASNVKSVDNTAAKSSVRAATTVNSRKSVAETATGGSAITSAAGARSSKLSSSTTNGDNSDLFESSSSDGAITNSGNQRSATGASTVVTSDASEESSSPRNTGTSVRVSSGGAISATSAAATTGGTPSSASRIGYSFVLFTAALSAVVASLL